MTKNSVTTILWRQLKKNRALSAAVLLGLVASHLVMVVTALTPQPVVFAVAAVGAYVTEYFAVRRAEPVLWHIGQMGAGQGHRFLLRDLLVLVLLLRTGAQPDPAVVALAAGVCGAHLARVFISVEQTYIRKCRRLQVLTRNVNLDELRIPSAPNPGLMRGGQRRALHLALPAVLGALTGEVLSLPTATYIGAAATLVLAAGWGGALAWHALRNRHLRDKDAASEEVFARLREHAPEVVLYYSLDPKLSPNAYQVDMWIPALERLSRKYMILVRERAHIERIGRTTAPVVCLTGGSEVMNLDVPSLKVALYVGNTGKNIHLLRHPQLKHVFIGHGDSDKAASANPFCKVYDRVFVAGEAARDRFHAAESGVSDSAMVEVGRPQLGEIAPRGVGSPTEIFTVLYAPTWEGWTADTDVTSVTHMGPEIIARLLAMPFPVRIIYKPHPLTGVRDRRTRDAHQQILRLLKDTNEVTAAGDSAEERAACDEVKAQRDELRKRYTQAMAKPARTDSTHRARDNRATDPDHKARLDQWEKEISRMFWGIHPPTHHRIVLDASPALYDCFNESDMMVSDVSSVVSDYIMSQKPYIVTNPTDIPNTEFLAQTTAARGAFLLSSDCAQLEDVVTEVRDNPRDAMVEHRVKTMRYLLGDEPADSQRRFAGAIDALAAERTFS